MSVGKKIFALRSEKGLRQKDFASILGVSASTIGMWETDKRQPDLAALKKIADYFNVTTDYLLGIEKADSFTKRLVSYNMLSSELGETQNVIRENSADYVTVGHELQKILIEAFDKLNNINQYIAVGEIMKLLKEQKESEPDEQPSEDLSEVEKQLEEAIRTQKGDKNTKIG